MDWCLILTWPTTGSSVSHRITTQILDWLSLPHEKNSCLLKKHINKCSTLYFLYEPNETVQPKFTKRISPLGFQQLCATNSFVDIHIINLFIIRFKRKALWKKCCGSAILLPSQRYSLMHAIFPFHSWGDTSKGSEQRSESTYLRPQLLWTFSCCLAVRHTDQIHDNFHKYDMPNAAQHSIITIPENTATHNF